MANSEIFILIATGSRLVGIILLIFFILPVQFKEFRAGGIANIAKLKTLLLGLGLAILITNVAPFLIHVCRSDILLSSCSTNNILVAQLSALSAINSLITIFLLYLIYHQKYNK